jgi:hypothetical protein
VERAQSCDRHESTWSAPARAAIGSRSAPAQTYDERGIARPHVWVPRRWLDPWYRPLRRRRPFSTLHGDPPRRDAGSAFGQPDREQVEFHGDLVPRRIGGTLGHLVQEGRSALEHFG